MKDDLNIILAQKQTLSGCLFKAKAKDIYKLSKRIAEKLDKEGYFCDREYTEYFPFEDGRGKMEEIILNCLSDIQNE